MFGPDTTKLNSLISKCLRLENENNISELQQCLYELYTLLNVRGGSKLVIRCEKKLDLAMCFSFMLHYDWEHNPQIREVWAEDAFYCIVDLMEEYQPDGEDMIALFALLTVGRKSLEPKIQDILNKSRMLYDHRIFDRDDCVNGANYVIDQFAFLAVEGLRSLGHQAIPYIHSICMKYDGIDFFQEITQKTYIRNQPAESILKKMYFVKNDIASILEEA